ncbi:MAG: TetR/AcrR family transcriptional regulator [Myxococcales bacterium]|nr:TetR/AcrR family transcriptional regulator [Myxococcales bacterium]HIK84323.1 TetR/AcrR family transcriptional regulator [Myxococcales bacterium]
MTSASANSPPRRSARYKNVRAPKRLLRPSVEASLTARQLEILDTLDASVLRSDFADLTMAEIARRMSCSLRTLYDIAPSKDALVLAVADRQLRRVGREAMEALETDLPPLDRLRAYLRATNRVLQPKTVLFSESFRKFEGATELAEAHTRYIVEITRSLLDEAEQEGEIAAVDTSAIAFVLGRLGREFSRSETEGVGQKSPRESADLVAEIILSGLLATRT